MKGCVAVLDIGKTNTKLVVFDPAGKVVAERSQDSAPLKPDAGWPYLRLDTERAWAFYLAALKDVGSEISDRGRLGRRPRRGRRACQRARASLRRRWTTSSTASPPSTPTTMR